MTTPTIADYLKYANLQMAAEAFLKDPKTNAESYSGDALRDALIDGNKRYTSFTASEAAKFAEDWEVVDQCKNTTTGFSGTLFRCKVTDPSRGLKEGEYVLSFRSTEFIDDAVRDSAATNTLEIHDTGWAWGQIADMEAWYESIKNEIPAGVKPNVTGYSLGGHLATAFNLLHQDDKAANGSDVIKEVITFNGAGVGEITEGGEGDANLIPVRKPVACSCCRHSRAGGNPVISVRKPVSLSRICL
jgi:hypothetical protein